MLVFSRDFGGVWERILAVSQFYAHWAIWQATIWRLGGAHARGGGKGELGRFRLREGPAGVRIGGEGYIGSLGRCAEVGEVADTAGERALGDSKADKKDSESLWGSESLSAPLSSPRPLSSLSESSSSL